ncbi:uncharacterized protein LOC110448503 isoform X2 [Mizuhopecten yessoensis]|uniref:uncharacterized protein LOC110448503 isoform X2 n=1 Tax=Mizuhopecten yessoensis TaxID=6573 RepID=UPI000B45B55D|nr:uncharacterized protein LOC110448503 isoform X2 [Mizuhopecten yessoensis]
MASQCQIASTRQEEKDRRLAILIQQQETLAARQLGAKSGHQYRQENQNLDRAIKTSLLYSSLKGRTLRSSQLGDIETDGPPAGQTSYPDPLLTFHEGNLLPQVNSKSVPMMSFRRARQFRVSDSSDDSHMGALADEHMVWQQTALVDGGQYNLSNEDSPNSQTNENRNTIPSNLNEKTLSHDDEDSPEIQGASNFSERPRSRGNEDEDDISREIEQLFKMGAISSAEAETIQESQQRKFRLNNMTKWQRNSDDEELRPFVFDTDGIPINWTDDMESTNQRPGLSMDVRLVELHPGQMEYDKIDDEFNETGIKITKIERIQNTYLLERFKSEMEDTTRRRHSGFDLNIRYLYHGTKADKSRVSEEGLDQRLSRMGYFGKGIYFSDNPLKCVHYTENMDSLGDAYILKCRVILGDSKGCPRDYNEFVVYENRRAMIEYIISFKLGPEGTAAMQQLNTPSVSVANTPGGEGEPVDDNHLDRIREVREAVRRKRCQDRGIIYSEPNKQRKHKDDQMWNKLQMLHGVKPEVDKPGKIIPGASAPVQELSSQSDDAKINNTDSLTMSGGVNYEQEPDPVEQVMSGLLQEFLGVTDTDDVEIAKYYITTNKMNINDALMNYYNDLP